MLVFKHNEHQVESAKQFATQLGFRFFRTKVSSRFDTKFDLAPPTEHKVEWKNVAFSCMAQDTKSLYLSAEGYWYPCCYTHAASEEKYDSSWGVPIPQLTNARWESLQEMIISNPPKACIRSCGTTYNKGQWTGKWELNV
jgi:hypothetical protein